MSRRKQQTRWYVYLLTPIGCLLLILAIPLSIPFAFLMAGIQSIGEKQFRRRMKEHGRFIEWADLLPSLTAGEGTLIIEQATKCPVRIWWTPEDALPLAPCPPPSREELDDLCILPWPKKSHEFVTWCHRRYTDENHGTAIITLPTLELPPGLFFSTFFYERFPRISVVDTIYSLDDSGALTAETHAEVR